jgi:hypothetical protein
MSDGRSETPAAAAFVPLRAHLDTTPEGNPTQGDDFVSRRDRFEGSTYLFERLPGTPPPLAASTI